VLQKNIQVLKPQSPVDLKPQSPIDFSNLNCH